MSIWIKKHHKQQKTGRREFFKTAWKVLGGIATFEFTYFTLNMLKTSEKKTQFEGNQNIKRVANVTDIPPGSVIANRSGRFYLVRQQDGGFIALSLTCSHLGCSVTWDEEGKKFLCPCHSSAFDMYGNVINSPATRALDYLPVVIEKGNVCVDISRKIHRKKFDKQQLTYA